MKRFTFWRNAIVAETYIVEAEDEAAARELVGETDPVHTEWMDWDTRDFQLEDTEELDDLVLFVKSKDGVTT